MFPSCLPMEDWETGALSFSLDCTHDNKISIFLSSAAFSHLIRPKNVPRARKPSGCSAFSCWCKEKADSTGGFNDCSTGRPLVIQQHNHKQKSCYLAPSRSSITGSKYTCAVNLDTVSLVSHRAAHILPFIPKIPPNCSRLLACQVRSLRTETALSIFSAWHRSRTATRLLTAASKFVHVCSDSSCVRSSKPCSCMNLVQSCPQASKLRSCWYHASHPCLPDLLLVSCSGSARDIPWQWMLVIRTSPSSEYYSFQ